MSVFRWKADVSHSGVHSRVCRRDVGGTGEGEWVVVNQVLSRVPRGGVVPRFDGRQIHPHPAATTDHPNVRTSAPPVRASELLFVDPSVSDLDTILRNLRPGVEAIVLDTE